MRKLQTAVIMAAGLGTRFGEMTETKPKGFIEVGGISMIERSIKILVDCGISRIIIGTGYHSEAYEQLAKEYPQIECCFSSLYAQTNSMYTLYNCRETIGDDDFLLLESDLVFEKRAIISLLESQWEDIMLISPVTKFQDQYYVECNENHVLTRCSVNKQDLTPSGELVGIHKISNVFYKIMCSDYSAKFSEEPKLGYEFELEDISRKKRPLNVLKLEGLKWYEIDDELDKTYAEKNIIKYL